MKNLILLALVFGATIARADRSEVAQGISNKDRQAPSKSTASQQSDLVSLKDAKGFLNRDFGSGSDDLSFYYVQGGKIFVSPKGVRQGSPYCKIVSSGVTKKGAISVTSVGKFLGFTNEAQAKTAAQSKVGATVNNVIEYCNIETENGLVKRSTLESVFGDLITFDFPRLGPEVRADVNFRKLESCSYDFSVKVLNTVKQTRGLREPERQVLAIHDMAARICFKNERPTADNLGPAISDRAIVDGLFRALDSVFNRNST